ncbi:squalene/phytoene synthase family protein [Streptomyces sp. NPDC014735]|uniref:squalene/phytoene synthase family protein n=1 Tax=Streptomyces sp. NPDC014735 TaxID=3364887 RepID=UPI0036FACC2C
MRTKRREEYLAARLLLPASLRPFIMVVVAFMDETDGRIDQGDRGLRQKALQAWDRDVRTALEGGVDVQSGTLRALADTARRFAHLTARVHEFLDGAPVEAAWTGFETETDFQRYVDSYSMPALMLTASFIEPAPESDKHEPFLQGCRRLIEAMQRTDFLADLPEDLEQGRVGIPKDALQQQGLDIARLRAQQREAASGAERVVTVQADLAAEAFSGCDGLPALVDPQYRPFLRALVSVQQLRLEAVKQNTESILQTGASPSALSAACVLLREYRSARREQN